METRAFSRETLVNGTPRTIRCAEIAGQVYTISNGWLRIASLDDDWYDDVNNPELVLEELKKCRDLKADLFTFWQRPPQTERRFSYFSEPVPVAILPISTYDHWISKQLDMKARNKVRKAARRGVTCTVTQFDDQFITGMTRIFNESPIRQGRPFWHYGKDFTTVKQQFSRFVHREIMIRADFEGQMIGHAILGNAGAFALTGQVISSLHHRDKSVNNALIAKAVAVCEEIGLRYICFDYWNDNSLTAFKQNCGFQRMDVPRYYVPLTPKGEIALRLGAHRSLVSAIPPRLKEPLKRIRAAWYASTSR